jgi:hypothetical protein
MTFHLSSYEMRDAQLANVTKVGRRPNHLLAGDHRKHEHLRVGVSMCST